MVFFESVHRVEETLGAMVAAFGADRRAALCRELTKTHEEVRRGSLGELLAGVPGVRGEITIVVAGGGGVEPVSADPAELAAQVAELVEHGLSRRDAVDQVAAATGLSRREVYAAAHGRGDRAGRTPPTALGERHRVLAMSASSADAPALKVRIRADLTAAMKARDSLTVSTLRMALAAITNEEVAGAEAKALSDAEVVTVLAREIKKRKEAADTYAAASRVRPGRPGDR